MGVLPLEFAAGETAASLGLTGREVFEFEGLASTLASDKKVLVRARNEKGEVKSFSTKARIDTPEELLYYQNGGILPYVLRQML